MTRLGHVVMKLPLDLRLCRVVLYGLLMGCPCDAVVLAVALQVGTPRSMSLCGSLRTYGLSMSTGTYPLSLSCGTPQLTM